MNLDPDDPSGARTRLLIKLIAGLVVTGVVLGLGIGYASTNVLESLGLQEQPVPESTKQSDRDSDDSEAEPDEDESGEADSDETEESEPEEEETEDKPKVKRGPRLTVNPDTPAAGQEMTLSGRFPGESGGTAQVQRRLKGEGWEDFPVTATIRPDGTYSTFIYTSITGATKFRMVHLETGKATDPVPVTIG